MTRRRLGCSVICGVVLAGVHPTAAVSAQTPTAGISGHAIFDVYCASCHGKSAKGDGTLAGMLKKRPADLTGIAKRNGGTFPADQVARIIDGKRPVSGHGGGEMPVWGDAFAKSIDTMPADEKIRRLVAYLESIQAKP